MQRPIFALILTLGLATPPADNYPKNPNIDIINYRFALTLTDTSDEIVGETTVLARFLIDGIAELRLDLIKQSTARNGFGMSVSSVTSGGNAVEFRHQNDALLITLPSSSKAHEQRAFTIAYSGKPETGLVIGPNMHGDRTFFSDNWPNRARHWLPTVDHPYDKATSEFIITAPSHYQVVSNGLLIEETDVTRGMRRSHWKHSVPIATWLNAIGVARFAVQHVDTYQGKAIQTWVYAQDRDAGFYDFAVPTKDVLEFYGDRVGPFSYEKLANVQSNSVRGGMEASTAIFYGASSVTGDRSVRWRNVIIHEVAHHWFGNSVTEYDWDDVWLSEGFATYFTLLYIEHAYGRDEFVEGLKSSRDRVFQFYRQNPDYRIVHDNLSNMRDVTSSQTYQKGGWTLHMLRGLIGDDAFWQGIRAYYAEFQNANATTDDFRRAMEAASGQELEWFFQQWLYSGGGLIVDGDWQYNEGRGVLSVRLDQVQNDGYTFRVPIELAIYTEGAQRPRIERIEIGELHNQYEIAVDTRPTRVVLDPGTWVLMEATFARRP